jgi:hypothetical protein
MGIMTKTYIRTHFPDILEEVVAAGFPRKPDQVIQPWQFGDEAQKTTCLWLHGLPRLKPTNIVGKGDFYVSPSGITMPGWYGDAADETGTKLAWNGPEIKKLRSTTFAGIAAAMADQWSGTTIPVIKHLNLF